MATTTIGTTAVGATDTSPTSTAWSTVLDSLAAQVDLQEQCVRMGHEPPPDLEITPPTTLLEGTDRLRALELYERCEALALDAAKVLATGRPVQRSVYGA